MRRLAPLLVLGAFAALAAYGLGTLPLSHEDEAWLAAPGWTFWETGRFASPAFEGFFGMERHYYGFLPLFPILVGGAMHLLGPSLASARVVPLLLSAATLALTYALARRLLSRPHALLALAILASWPVQAATARLASGVPMLDLARHVRNDVAVAAFGTAALLLALPAIPEGRPRRFFAAGLLAGLAALGHVWGLAFVAVVLAGMLLRRARARAAAAFLAGAALPIVPFLVFAASGWSDFLAQNRQYASRFAISPRFLLENLLHEPARYGLLARRALAGSPAAILLLAAAGAGLVALWRRRREAGGLLLVAVAGVPALFALFLEPKNVTYLAPVWPLIAIAASAGIVAAWRGASRPARVFLCVVVGAAFVEGAVVLGGFLARVRTTTPYETVAVRLRALVPPGARVLAMHPWWFALGPGREGYRSLFVPIVLTDPRFTPDPRPFAENVAALRPDLVLIDPSIRGFLESASPGAFAPLQADLRAWLAARTRVAALLEDPAYGKLEVRSVTPAACAPAR